MKKRIPRQSKRKEQAVYLGCPREMESKKKKYAQLLKKSPKEKTEQGDLENYRGGFLGEKEVKREMQGKGRRGSPGP